MMPRVSQAVSQSPRTFSSCSSWRLKYAASLARSRSCGGGLIGLVVGGGRGGGVIGGVE